MPTFSINELAQKISAKIIGDDQLIIVRLASIDSAQLGDLTCLKANSHRRYLASTKASAVILREENATDCLVTKLIVKNPEIAFAKIAELFNPMKKPTPGIHPTAIIAPSAIIDSSTSIGANCVIGEHVVIEKNTVILPSVVINNNVKIGSDCLIYNSVTLYHDILIGNRVILHSGVVIGSDGFGFAFDQDHFEKIPQIGSVVISDDVEIGANTCIDRGALSNTTIECGVKIDNLVQIAHNVVIGAHTVIAACTGIAGSTHIGKYCVIGGAVSIAGHLTIADGVTLTGTATVRKSIKEPGIYSSGTELLPNKEWRRFVIRFRKNAQESRRSEKNRSILNRK